MDAAGLPDPLSAAAEWHNVRYLPKAAAAPEW
jgi:hypothetical protein